MTTTKEGPRTISFNFEGKTYEAPIDAYMTNLIALPDGRLLMVSKWFDKVSPPIPMNLRAIPSVPATAIIA
jgi:hypothetical protein